MIHLFYICSIFNSSSIADTLQECISGIQEEGKNYDTVGKMIP